MKWGMRLSRVGARKISTCEYPVLFEAPLAAGLLGHFVQAVSGGALYRKNTFLADSLGQPVFAGHVEITENPFIPNEQEFIVLFLIHIYR